MPALMVDSDQPAVLLEPLFAGCRVATYADLVTPEIMTAAAGRLVVIDRGTGDPHGMATVADIEPGCFTVPDGIALIREWISQGRPHPTAYHDRAEWGAVSGAGLDLNFAHWVATLDGTLVSDGVRAPVVQFAPAAVLGVHADLSIVWDDTWHPMPSGPTPAQLGSLVKLATTSAQASSQLLKELRAV